jgi:hypothetical protein
MHSKTRHPHFLLQRNVGVLFLSALLPTFCIQEYVKRNVGVLFLSALLPTFCIQEYVKRNVGVLIKQFKRSWKISSKIFYVYLYQNFSK